MEWRDNGILLSEKQYGEGSFLVYALTENHGLHAGFSRKNKENCSLLQPGNLLHLCWRGRTHEHAGYYNIEPLRFCGQAAFESRLALNVLNSFRTLTLTFLPERVPYPKTYKQAVVFLNALFFRKNWLHHYILWEYIFLQEMGYGLDLNSCAATGIRDRENLIYISPKSGRAVCQDAGAPYASKLFRLPRVFFCDFQDQENQPEFPLQEYVLGLEVMEHFLIQRAVTAQMIKKLPSPRLQLKDTLIEFGLI
jgi:DNA repair protein RecO (recombination protein O)